MENKIVKIQKRNGEIVDFSHDKITDAIFKAITAIEQGDGKKSKQLSDKVVEIMNRRFKKDELPQVEQIQDVVEEVLIMEGMVDIARAYILYREQRRRIREATKVVDESSEKIDSYLKELDWQVNENANMTFSLQGLNQYVGSYISKKYWLNKIYPKEVREAGANEDFHIHNLEILAPYCAGWDLYDFLKKGFGGVSGKLECRPPKHLRTALGQLINILFTLQGETAGANAVSNFDTLLAPFIRYDGLAYPQVKQAMQEFLFNCMVPTRVGFQSLCWDEIVIIKEKGKIKFEEIGKLIDKEFNKNPHRIIEKNSQSYAVENHDDYYTLSFDKNGKAVWAKIKAFIRHKVPKNSGFVKIKTNRGEAKVSRAHSLFSFQKFDGKFNPLAKSAEDIKIARDYRQLNPENHFLSLKFLENSGRKKQIDLVEIINNIPQLQKNVFVQINPTRTLEGIRRNILLEKQSFVPFYKEFGLKDRGIWQDWLERKSIRYDIWRRYGEQKQEINFKFKNSENYYPRILKGKILEEFVKLCAWYIIEGHTAISTPLYISQSPSDNSEEIIGLLRGLGALGQIAENSSYSPKKKVSGKVFKITGKGLLCEIVGRICGYLSFNKIIPSFIFELSPEYQEIFLKTLLKGDGSEYENHWDFGTTSRKLATGLGLLLAQNNYRFNVYTENTSQKNIKWRDKLIVRIHKNNSKPRKFYFVNDFEASACLKVDSFEYQKDYEYDISVDLPQENFIGGTGLLVFHNTPFLNVTLDINVPSFLAKQPVIAGGVPQKEIYGDFQSEMDMFNKAFYEVIVEGDAKGRPFTFPIPTVSITKDFNWDNPVLDPLWEASARYGINYFQNFIKSDMKPEDVRSMCCRLRLNNKELYMTGGGLFGSAPLTGSIGVTTANLPRIGYLSKTKKEFFERLGNVMDLAKESLEIKRKALENFMEKGLYPYSRFYLSSVKKMRDSYFGNHFSTIGLIGMNEALLNFLGENIASKSGKRFALEVLDYMRERLIKYQEETGNLYNLEATPGEGTSYRQAKSDREKYPDIITAGTKESPYYTNSSQLPVNYTDDVFEALKLQDDLQCKYTGGTVFHMFLGEKIDEISMAKNLVKKVFENFSLPYITLTPTFSICPSHGYLSGEHFFCPECAIKQPCEVYSRVVGYIRPVQQWHIGKKQEFKERKEFKAKI